MEHHERADELDGQADDLEEQSERLRNEVADVRDDREAKGRRVAAASTAPRGRAAEPGDRGGTLGLAPRADQEVDLVLLAHDHVLEHVLERLGAPLLAGV